MEEINPIYEERFKRLEEKINQNYKDDEKTYQLLIDKMDAIRKDVDDVKEQGKNIAKLEVLVEQQAKNSKEQMENVAKLIDNISGIVTKQAETAQEHGLMIQKMIDLQEANSEKIQDHDSKINEIEKTESIFYKKAFLYASGIVVFVILAFVFLAIGGEDNGWQQSIKAAIDIIKGIFI